jgi:hypothetical protein
MSKAEAVTPRKIAIRSDGKSARRASPPGSSPRRRLTPVIIAGVGARLLHLGAFEILAIETDEESIMAKAARALLGCGGGQDGS